MREFLQRYWVIIPVLASMASQCDQTPRGTMPTQITSVDLIFKGVGATVPADPTGSAAYESCLQRMDGLPNHIRASWRGNAISLLTEKSTNVWAATFGDVPVGFTNTMTVHDPNECARDPDGNGHVVRGITVNGTVVDQVVGDDKTLVFEVRADGSVGGPSR